MLLGLAFALAAIRTANLKDVHSSMPMVVLTDIPGVCHPYILNASSLRFDAERAVKRIEGVEKVINNIEVLPTSPNDDRIRLAVYRAIYGHPALNMYQLRAVPPIHIIVKNGHGTLEGVVAGQMDKQIAEMHAKSVPGVFSVTNNLRVEEEGKNR